jgi:hypothetical protein
MWKNKKFINGLQHRLLFLWRGGWVVRPKKKYMKQKLLLLTITFFLVGSVSFHESIACDPKPKKVNGKVQTAAIKQTAKADALPFDLFPFAQTFLLN